MGTSGPWGPPMEELQGSVSLGSRSRLQPAEGTSKAAHRPAQRSPHGENGVPTPVAARTQLVSNRTRLAAREIPSRSLSQWRCFPGATTRSSRARLLSPKPADFLVLLDHPTPRLRVYRRETVVAEKLQAMVALGLANSTFVNHPP